MTVYYNETAKAYNGYTAEQVLEFASLASNEANKDDPIDSAVLRAYAQMKGAANVDAAVDKRKTMYSLDKDGFIGFNPIVKRTCAAVDCLHILPCSLSLPDSDEVFAFTIGQSGD